MRSKCIARVEKRANKWMHRIGAFCLWMGSISLFLEICPQLDCQTHLLNLVCPNPEFSNTTLPGVIAPIAPFTRRVFLLRTTASATAKSLGCQGLPRGRSCQVKDKGKGPGLDRTHVN